jgi:hypothetical protein
MAGDREIIHRANNPDLFHFLRLALPLRSESSSSRRVRSERDSERESDPPT